jgi:hypothetical protein
MSNAEVEPVYYDLVIVAASPTSMWIWPSIPSTTPRSFRWWRVPAPSRAVENDAPRASPLARAPHADTLGGPMAIGTLT